MNNIVVSNDFNGFEIIKLASHETTLKHISPLQVHHQSIDIGE